MASASAFQSQAAATQPQTDSPARPNAPLSAEVVIRNPHGLHLRLAAELSRLCRNYDARLTLANSKGRSADAGSPLSLLTLAAACGTRLTATANGPDAEALLQKAVAFFDTATC